MIMADFFAFLQTQMWFTLTWAGVLGVVLGSFLNVVILRWPVRMEEDWRAQAREILGLESPNEATPVSAPGIHEHSRCPHCQNPIRWFDNVPILSYLALRGRCRHCRAQISLQYPVVEALAGLGVVLAVLGFGVTWMALFASVAWLILLTLSIIDLRTMLLPDPLVYVLLWGGLLGSAIGVPGFPTLAHAVWGAAAGYLSLWSFYWLFKLIRGKEGLGYGDFKLFAALGAWCGWQGLIPIMIVATAAGLVGALLAWLCKRDPTAPLPFGPSLAAGGVITLAFPHWIEGPLAFLRTHPVVLAALH